MSESITARQHPDRAKWDVVIYEIGTGKVNTIAGTDLPETGSFHTVAKRLDTVRERLNEAYYAIRVPPGKYKKGDIISKEDQEANDD